jgi:hypothetical protein
LRFGRELWQVPTSLQVADDGSLSVGPDDSSFVVGHLLLMDGYRAVNLHGALIFWTSIYPVIVIEKKENEFTNTNLRNFLP